jgi:hypothetical protein
MTETSARQFADLSPLCHASPAQYVLAKRGGRHGNFDTSKIEEASTRMASPSVINSE